MNASTSLRSFGLGLVGLAVAASSAGCNGPFVEGTLPDQLEPLSVLAPNDQGGTLGASGMVHVVANGDRAFTLSVGDAATAISLDVHTPGNSPLMQLDQKPATVQATSMEEGGRSLVLSDADGPLYIASFGDDAGNSSLEKTLGKGFVTHGEEVARQGDGTFIWSYTKGVFKTDEGDVALLPGEVKVIEIDGVSWRAVVTVAFTATTDPSASALPDCGPGDMLGFEMLRITDPSSVATEKLLRAGKDIAYVGCTAPGGEE